MNPSKHRLYKAVQACKAKEIQALVQQYKVKGSWSSFLAQLHRY